MIFESNFKYSLSIFFSSLLMLISSSFSILHYVSDEIFTSLLFAVVPLVLVIGYSFIIPREISITEKYVKFKTIFISRSIPIRAIKSVKEVYSTKSMIWYADDKSKAQMLCSVRYGKFPLAFFLIHNGISNYKKASELIKNINISHNRVAGGV